MLYPLKFRPLLKERIWGGDLLSTAMGKRLPAGKKIGESWEISGVVGDISTVASGALKGNNLQELIEVYMGDLVGEKVYERFGLEFPLLIKLIDAEDVLSVQVHPDDALAAERHNSFGKTEMWYVVDCLPGASLYVGFDGRVTREQYLAAVAAGELPSLLRRVEVRPGDTFFIPAGTIHAIGKGILIAEIQQTSDVTYRVDDWGRVDDNGNPRQLHTELAVDAIDFEGGQNCIATRQPVRNEAVTLVECPYFTTNVVELDGEMLRDYSRLDSFVIYICLDGSTSIRGVDGSETVVVNGESVLLPAEESEATLTGRSRLLEVYIGSL
ncbi:MAG: class I mannose-6-phosphate isomerase [Rikenellaceae bacterium]|jgi:mannose-6-phosphate isomerase|nr:class I mannose-6-phosphate isomerase [Rikenellaceae bacterium]